VYQPNTKFKEKRNATSQHSARKASCYFVQKNGQKEKKKEEKIGENLVFLVGVRDQLQQRLHLVSYPLPPKLQQTHGESEQEDT